MTDRPTFKGLKDKALKSPDVKAAYDASAAVFAMKRDMIAMRTAAGKTQEDMAKLLKTKHSAISRLESVNNSVSPSLSTIDDYARVLGFRAKVTFEPLPEKR